ncbi:MAG: hypothetical protein KatS3mg087_0451 [Patescibacteria group bacterium]|nr:MAG: hypothetical protein KatS3mg087_0451 [Patescibacteria group bacterium]
MKVSAASPSNFTGFCPFLAFLPLWPLTFLSRVGYSIATSRIRLTPTRCLLLFSKLTCGRVPNPPTLTKTGEYRGETEK